MDEVENRFRNKITFIQFLLSVGIVYQHTIWNYKGNNMLNMGQSFLFFLIETCVPFFFMISGYLFLGHTIHQRSRQKSCQELRRY